LLGNVAGLDVLQLSCAGDASQAFSLVNLGAHVMACDFSPFAIEEAKRNASELGLEVRFVVVDSQRLANFAEGQFDLVHVDGNLIYYEDLPTAFYNWHRVLKTGGCLFLH
jgi:ubiquinone/menaquinone biosynthesis C-methylase UbiE